MDNLVGYHTTLSQLNQPASLTGSKRLDFYFDVFLQTHKKVRINDYVKEIERYNQNLRDYGELGEKTFFSEVDKKYPEFHAIFQKSLEKKPDIRMDLIQFIMAHSEFLNKEENKWMKTVLEVVRNTSIFFQPQIRTKIMNEGWASYWHEILFMQDDRIQGHEVDFARVNANVTSMPRVGMNPYALGMRLFYYIEDVADKGKYSIEFKRLLDTRERDAYDRKTAVGRDFIFKIRENFNDFLFINTFVDQDFVNRYNLFVAGKRLNRSKMVWEYFVQSRKAEDYRQMVIDSLYHPPHIQVHQKKSVDGTLYLDHRFEGKPLVKDFIPNTMLGIEYLWGAPVKLETSEVAPTASLQGAYGAGGPTAQDPPKEPEIQWQRVLYTLENRKLSKRILYAMDDQP